MSTNFEASLALSADSLIHETSTNITTTPASPSSLPNAPTSTQSHSHILSVSPSHYHHPVPLESSRPQHIPRPPNAFILYRSDVIRRYKEAQKTSPGGAAEEKKQQTFSKVAGEGWRKLSDEERQVWLDLAEERKLAHQERFPEYRFAPRRSSRPVVPEEEAKMEGDSQESVKRICSLLNISDRPGIIPRRKEPRSKRSQRGLERSDPRQLRSFPAPYLVHGDPGLPPYFPQARMSPVDTYYPFGGLEFGAQTMPYGYASSPYPPPQHYAPIQSMASWGPASFYPQILDMNAYNNRALERPTAISSPGPGYITAVPSPSASGSVSPIAEQGSHTFDLDCPLIDPTATPNEHSPVDAQAVRSWQGEQEAPMLSPMSMSSAHESPEDTSSYYNTQLDEQPAFVDNINTADWQVDWMLGNPVSVDQSPSSGEEAEVAMETLYYPSPYFHSP